MARSISGRERLLLLAAAVMLVLAVGVRPLLSRLEGGGSLVGLGPQAGRLLEEKMKVIAAYREAVGRESYLTAEADALAEQIGAYDAALLPGATPPLAAAELQTHLKDLADRAGLRIQSEKILAHVKRDAFLEIPVQIVANGDIRTVKDFLVAVESSRLFVGVQDLSLKTVKRRQPGPGGMRESIDIQASVTFVGLIRGERG